MRTTKPIINIILFLLLFSLSMSETLRGTVSRVSDGDTLHIKTTTGKYKVRFYGIDAPESNQSFGSESTDFIRERVLHKSVIIEVTDIDRYGRQIGKIYYGNDNYLNKEVVEAGLAWWYEYYAKRDNDIRSAQEDARNNNRGLWEEGEPVAPWDFRRGIRKKIAEEKDKPKDINSVVHVTKSGKKYHRKDCNYLKSIWNSYALYDAKEKGYGACSRYY